jgi:hypothetical protein
MATLQFRGTDFRDLLDVLVQAVELAAAGERSAINVNGVIFGPDLSGIAALMPDAPLSKQHQAVVDAVVTELPEGRAQPRAARCRCGSVQGTPIGLEAVGRAHPDCWERPLSEVRTGPASPPEAPRRGRARGGRCRAPLPSWS